MGGKTIFNWALILCIGTIQANSQYYSKSVPFVPMQEKTTHLNFFFHDTLSGKNPTAVMVAHANLTGQKKSPTPFGTVFALDDPLTVGPETTSEVIGNARGLYVSASQGIPTLVAYFDFGFTTGEFNGSSISVFSRNPVAETERELAVVGGRGKFRMARGFAQLKTYYVNETNGDAIVEYNVTLSHY